MKKYRTIGIAALLGLTLVVAVASWYLGRHPVPVLQPAGQIGLKERDLLMWCALLSVTVVVPVFALLGLFVWKYHERNTNAKYEPDQGGNRLAEIIWWAIPGVLLVIISVITWRSSYALDPFKPLVSNKPALHIQVVGLDWKWLFIYPDQRVASVSEAAIPVDRPVTFDITSDTVMSSFWVPQLGGQMYAMPGMSTALNLEAGKAGMYNGSAANISGKGFSDMRFTVRAVSDADFDHWIASTRQVGGPLDAAAYATLAKPGTQKEPKYYSSVSTGLYDTILMKYMMPMDGTGATK